MEKLDDEFWSERYDSKATGWDVGEVSKPLKEYIDQIDTKTISILIPGCGNAYEAAYLLLKGFESITLVDISEHLFQNIKTKFSKEIADGRCEVIHADFFRMEGEFDLILEQTFFCALNPNLRIAYAQKMAELLKPGGKLVGLLFDMEKLDGPPFGGNLSEYKSLFSPYFDFKIMEPCHNSIPSRSGDELFMVLVKK